MKQLAKLLVSAGATLALAASLATSAMAEGEFEAEIYPATISAESNGEQILALPGEGEVKCKKASFTGELAKPATTVTVLPTYTECSAFRHRRIGRLERVRAGLQAGRRIE